MTRWSKLNQQLANGGISALPACLANWVYWNGKLYRVPVATRVREQLKYWKKTNKKFGIDSPIIVFQMGKVGSSSVYDALRNLDLDVPVYHAHVLNRFDVYADGVRQTRVAPETDLAAIEEGRALRRIVDSGRWQNWSVVTLVRAPIPRAVSEFFENIDAFVPDFWARWKAGTLTLEELIETFLHRYRDYSLLYWFDDQVREVFGIDVFASPFPREQGYRIYQGNGARLLLLRLEDMTRCGEKAFCEFLGLNHFQPTLRNVGARKVYGELYRQFVEQLKLSPAYIAEIHSSRYAQHFYTTEELEASVARWVNRPEESRGTYE